MPSQPTTPTPKNRGARPPATVFVGWLAFYIIAWLAYAGFGFDIPTAQHSGDKGGVLALGAMVWAFVGWIPVVISGFRAFARSDKPAHPESQ